MDFTRARGKDKPRLIDLVITEDGQSQVSPSIEAQMGKSDDAVIKWKYLVSVQEDAPSHVNIERKRYNYYKGNYNEFRRLYANTDCNAILDEDELDTDEMLNIFTSKIKDFQKQTIPLTQDKPGQKKQPWLTSGLFKTM